jgi:F0F1-type ATP synthase membrane subunit c/vacuolar-type H+-ATPase subunit K
MRVASTVRVAALLVGATLIPQNAAFGQESDSPAAEQLSQSQLEAFAGLADVSTDEIVRRVLWDPGLTPLIAAAADANLERRRLGKGMTIAGFSGMGAGILVGIVLVISSLRWDTGCPYEGGSNCTPQGDDEGQKHSGYILMVASVAVGLGVAIPGIIISSSTGATEDRALKRFQGQKDPPRPFAAPRALHAAAPGRSLGLPLVSLAF